MNYMTRLLIIALLIIASIDTYSQLDNRTEIFKHRTFYKPFTSEISSTLNKLSIGYTNNTFANDFMKSTTLTEIHLGMDAPILYGGGDQFRWALSIPISLHVLWAPFEEITAPIINNDYRFGLSFTGIQYLSNAYIKNLSYKVTPFAHESTHLGDEISLFGSKHEEFYRINVSYEYYELGITLNDPDTLSGNLLSFKFGLMGLINPNKGYYTFYEDEIGDKTFYKSERWLEYYLQLNYRKTNGFMANEKWNPTISIEARNRVKYEYESPGKEDRVWCLNAFIGYDYVPKNKNTKTIGHYLRYYRGINPHGQFRNFKYEFIGYSFLVYL